MVCGNHNSCVWILTTCTSQVNHSQTVGYTHCNRELCEFVKHHSWTDTVVLSVGVGTELNLLVPVHVCYYCVV